jgi:hypothetical protein
LYVYETSSLAPRDDDRVKVLESRVFQNISGKKAVRRRRIEGITCGVSANVIRTTK